MKKVYLVTIEWESDVFRVFDNEEAAQALVDDINQGEEGSGGWLEEMEVYSEYDPSVENRFWVDDDE